MTNNRSVINMVIAIVAVIAAYFFIVRPQINTYWDYQYKKDINDAVNGCIKAGTLTFTEAATGATHNEPIEEWYTRCMKDKGY